MAPRNDRQGADVEVRSPARSFAQTLDNFYAPTRDRRSEESFQRGVNTLSGMLGEQAAQAKKMERVDEHQQGVVDAMREDAGQELLGVKTGKLFRQHSKYYMLGLNETRGKAAASRWKSNLTIAYQNWDGRHIDDDGSAFRDWMNDQVSGFMGELGEDTSKIAGALPTINEVANNFAVQHTAFTAQRLEAESFEAYAEVISGVFDDMQGGLYDNEDGSRDWDKVITSLADEADDMYATDGAKANDHLVSTAIQYANTHNDPDAILALARAHDKGEIKISVSNQERLANAMDAVEADIARNTNRANAQATNEEKARNKAVVTEFSKILDADPYAPVTMLEGYDDLSGATKRSLMQMQTTYQTAASAVDPEISNMERMRLEQELHYAPNSSARQGIINAFVAGNPSGLSPSDISRYMGEAYALEDPSALINNQMVSKYRSNYASSMAEFQLGDGYDVNKSSFLRTYGERHFNDYMMAYAGNVDMQDPAAIQKAIKGAEEYATQQLTYQFPEVMRDKLDQGGSSLGKALGVGEALQQRDAEYTKEQEKAFLENNTGEDTVEPPAGTSETDIDPQDQEDAKVDIEPAKGPAEVIQASLDAEPTPYADADEGSPEYSEVRQGFYGKLIRRFTDGADNRPTMKMARVALKDDPEFNTAVERLAYKLDIDPMALMAIMEFESKFDPAVENAAGSKATGLIQFMPETARSLGTTVQALKGMNRVEQMVYVDKYFDQFAGRIRGGEVDDLYMAVLWPAAIGKPDGYKIFKSGTIAYRQNAGLDTNKDGSITKFEAAATVRKIFYSQ